MATFLWALVIIAVGFALFVRFAPSTTQRWHIPVEGAQNKDGANYALRVMSADETTMARAHKAMMALPRTTVLAGSPETGAVTYVTRSKLMGYPDYTTINQTGHMLKIYARSRFGRSDFGVNAARADRLVAAIEAG